MTIVSVDVESDGAIPGRNSMLSLGAAAYNEDGKELGTFYRNIYPLQDAKQDRDTMDWWKTEPKAWQRLQENRRVAVEVMQEFAEWFRSFKHPVMLAAPAGFDFTFIKWYLVTFVGTDSRWHGCIDLRSYWMALTGDYRGDYKREIEKLIPEGHLEHTHVAIDDAREQAQYFFAIKKEIEQSYIRRIPLEEK